MLIGIDANEANIPRRVGVNQYAFDLLHALRQLPLPHHFVVYLKHLPLPDMPPAGKNWEYRHLPFPKFWTQTRLPWDLYLHRPRPDVFFTPSHYAPRFSPVPTVISIMDLGFLGSPGQFTTKDYNQLRNWTAYSVKNAARILAISESTKRDIVRIYGRKPEDVTVTYPGFDKKLFRPVKKPHILAGYGIKSPYVLFLSSLKPNKNIEGLVRAFAGLHETGLTLVIAGKKAWLYDRIFDLVRELHLESRVVITGFVAEEDVPVLMTGASVFAMPSFWEGFGIPVLEAMACGTPVVISDRGSLPEAGGSAAVYVDPADIASITSGLKQALGSGRDELARKGRAWINNFGWEKTARQTISVLESAI